MGTENKESVLLATIAGFASGVIFGLLFAPAKGRETRKKISEKREQYRKDVKDEIEELRDNLNERFEAGSEDETPEKAKKKTSYDEWTKDELYEKAKRLKIEGYSTMNKSELIEALSNQ